MILSMSIDSVLIAAGLVSFLSFPIIVTRCFESLSKASTWRSSIGITFNPGSRYRVQIVLGMEGLRSYLFALFLTILTDFSIFGLENAKSKGRGLKGEVGAYLGVGVGCRKGSSLRTLDSLGMRISQCVSEALYP